MEEPEVYKDAKGTWEEILEHPNLDDDFKEFVESRIKEYTNRSKP